MGCILGVFLARLKSRLYCSAKSLVPFASIMLIFTLFVVSFLLEIYFSLIDITGAGEGNRTLVVSLEGFCSTIELHPRYGLSSAALCVRQALLGMVECTIHTTLAT
jgi:hypothetical protein